MKQIFFYIIIVVLSSCQEEDIPLKSIPDPKLKEASDVGSAGFKIEWDQVANAKSYLLDVSDDEDFDSYVLKEKSVLPPDGSTSAMSYKIKNLTPNTTYYFRLKAVKGEGKYGYSAVKSVRTLKLQAPVFEKPFNITSTSFEVRWNGVSGADKYFLDMCYDKDFTQFHVRRSLTRNNYIKFKELEANTIYFLRIKAAADHQESDYSDTLEVRTN